MALSLLGVAALLYLALCGVLFVKQRDFLYYPVMPGGVPAADEPAIQVIRIDTADGERLVAWYLPAQAGRPTFLFFGGNASSLTGQSDRWREIDGRGAGFLAIAWRGYEGSTGRPTETGLHADARAAHDWLARRLAPNEIVIHGFSLGTGPAVRLASERPARALILEAPYTSTADVAALDWPWIPVRWLMLDQYRSRDRIGAVRAPVLILHGDADEAIPFAQGEALYALANAPKRFMRMAGSHHNTLVRDGAYDHIWRFLGVPVEGATVDGEQEARAAMTTDSLDPAR